MSNNKELHAAQDLNQALQHEFKVSTSVVLQYPVELCSMGTGQGD